MFSQNAVQNYKKYFNHANKNEIFSQFFDILCYFDI